jgi:hypothetical protein
MRRRILCAVLALGCIAAAPPAPLLTYEQTGCAGACPSYVVTVDESGELAWTGRDHVAAVGERHARLSAEQLAALRETFARTELAKLPDVVGADCADAPHIIITYDGHRVEYRRCGRDRMLDWLEPRIEEALGIAPWISAAQAVLTFEQTMCLGHCPTYKVTTYDDGTEVWIGLSDVAVLGERRATLSAAQQRALAAEVKRVRFLDGGLDRPNCRTLKDGEVECWTAGCLDTPHTKITYADGARTHSMEDEHCQRDPGRTRFEDTVRRLLGLDRWIRPPR